MRRLTRVMHDHEYEAVQGGGDASNGQKEEAWKIVDQEHPHPRHKLHSAAVASQSDKPWL